MEPCPDHKGSIMELNKKAVLIILIFFSYYLFGENSIIKIEKGDTLYKISREYKVSVSLLLSYNGIENADNLNIGQEIRIPSSYTVKKGDTLYGIARKKKVSFDSLCVINGFQKNHLLKLGEILLLPEKSMQEKETIVTVKTVTEETNNSDFFWPHTGERVSMNGKLKGEEILGEKGDKIVSVSSGMVVWVAPYRGYGQLIMVENSDHHIYAYGGNDETFVKVGDKVLPGTTLGLMGINNVEKNAKAFFFVYKDGKPVAPEKAPRG